MKNFEEQLEEYLTDWAIKAGEEIDKKATKEKWDNFDFISAINFMLGDMKEDIVKLHKKNLKIPASEVKLETKKLIKFLKKTL